LSALLRGQRWFADEIPAAEPLPDARAVLTAKQVEVLALLAEGLSNRAIGKRMAVSENTVRSHVSAVLFQLRVNSRAEATVAARRLGLIQ
jgi:DNA-binding NarL/FixJ family response regulator